MFRKAWFCVAIPCLAIVLASYPALAQDGKAAGKGKFPQVKSAVVYENITDGTIIGRSVADTIELLKETRANLIFRGFWKWEPIVDSPDDIPAELSAYIQSPGMTHKQIVNRMKKSGKYYQSLKSWISAIKEEIPGIIFCGAIPAQQIGRVEFDPITHKVYNAQETWAMALDPKKWDITSEGELATKEQLQAMFVGIPPEKKGAGYDRAEVIEYFPDITNPDFQALLLNWAKKQIDCGADAIWVDMLYAQAKLFLQATNDPRHPAVVDSISAAAKIVDSIHQYASEKGKYVYVGSRGQDIAEFDAQSVFASLDFLTLNPSREEILNKMLNDKWAQKISVVREVYGNIPIFAFIEWAAENSPLAAFSQDLDPAAQAQVITAFDEGFGSLGVNFIYPLHGGNMGQDPDKFSFGLSRIYDSLAPEFGTYETIKGLARKKQP